MRYVICYLILSSLISLSSCSHTDENRENQLDIPLPLQPEEKSLPLEVDSQLKSSSTAHQVHVLNEAMFDWKLFFRPSPSESEKSMLAKKISDSATLSEANDFIKRAQQESALGNFKQAEISFLEALQLDSQSKEAMLGLAAIYLQINEIKKSFNILAKIKQLLQSMESEDKILIFRYKYTLAMAYIKHGRKEISREILLDLIRYEKSFVPGYTALAFSYLEEDKKDVALFIVQRGLDQAGEHPAFFNIMGIIAMLDSQPEKAHGFFQKALSIDKNHVASLVNQANLYMDQLEFEAAKKNLLMAIEYNPNHVVSHILLGILFSNGYKEYEDAEHAFLKAVELDPQNVYARYNLAIIMLRNEKNSPKAIQYFNEVMQMTLSTDELHKLSFDLIQEIQSNKNIL